MAKGSCLDRTGREAQLFDVGRKGVSSIPSTAHFSGFTRVPQTQVREELILFPIGQHSKAMTSRRSVTSRLSVDNQKCCCHSTFITASPHQCLLVLLVHLRYRKLEESVLFTVYF